VVTSMFRRRRPSAMLEATCSSKWK
jgi:hypothetical protein